MAVSIAVCRSRLAKNGQDLLVVVESELHVGRIWTTIALQGSVDCLESGSECGGEIVDISLPEPRSRGPAETWVSANWVWVLEVTIVSVDCLRESLVVVVPGQLQAATAVVNDILATARICWVRVLAGLHVLDAVLLNGVLPADGFPAGMSQVLGSFANGGD